MSPSGHSSDFDVYQALSQQWRDSSAYGSFVRDCRENTEVFAVLFGARETARNHSRRVKGFLAATAATVRMRSFFAIRD